MTLELSKGDRRDLARHLRNAVRAKIRCWDAMTLIEGILGTDLDDMGSYIEAIAVGVDEPDYTLEEAMSDCEDLIKEAKEILDGIPEDTDS